MTPKEKRIESLLIIVKNAINLIKERRNFGNDFNIVYDTADTVRFAIYELKDITQENMELYTLVKDAHLSLTNSVQIAFMNLQITNSPFKKGKNHIYTLLQNYDEQTKK